MKDKSKIELAVNALKEELKVIKVAFGLSEKDNKVNSKN